MVQIVRAEVAIAAAPLVAHDHAVAIQIDIVEADASRRLRHQRGAASANVAATRTTRLCLKREESSVLLHAHEQRCAGNGGCSSTGG